MTAMGCQAACMLCSRSTTDYPSKAQQSGAGLLIMLLIVVGVAVALFAGRPVSYQGQLNLNKTTNAALVTAKQALLGYAVSDSNRPGELPCPDFNNDGVITATGANRDYNGSQCRTGANAPGWLPWERLRLPDLRDGNGDRLWYVVSDDFHAGSTVSINPDTSGQLILDANAADPVVAIIFSAGAPLNGQTNRPGYAAGNPGNATIHINNFLERENSDSDTDFVTNDPLDPDLDGDITPEDGVVDINDRLITIRKSELMLLLEKRVAREIQTDLANYKLANGYFPYAATTGDTTNACAPGNYRGFLPLDAGTCGQPLLTLGLTWIQGNDWDDHVYYTLATDCSAADSTGCDSTGRGITLDGADGIDTLLSTTGPVITQAPFPESKPAAQTRPSAIINDYLDTLENSNGDDTYVNSVSSDNYNDQIFSLP